MTAKLAAGKVGSTGEGGMTMTTGMAGGSIMMTTWQGGWWQQRQQGSSKDGSGSVKIRTSVAAGSSRARRLIKLSKCGGSCQRWSATLVAQMRHGA